MSRKSIFLQYLFLFLSLSAHVVYHHFKMESIWTAIKLMVSNCFMTFIDLKDAYYSVLIE